MADENGEEVKKSGGGKGVDYCFSSFSSCSTISSCWRSIFLILAGYIIS